MISLVNAKRNADSYTVLLMMEKSDTLDMLPNKERPLSPKYYRVMTNYGVPAMGSLAINYATQEQYIYGADGWSEATPETILGILNAVENKTYLPEDGLDGYNKVVVEVPQLDTSDATAVAGDILTGKTAYVKDEKVTGTLGTQTKTATPSSASQTIAPDTGKLLSSVVVEAAPLDAAKTVTAGTTAQTVSPTAGKLGIKSVTINPTPSSAKTVTPSDEEQTVSPEDGELLSSVTVEAAPLDPPQTAAARTDPLTVFPSSGKIGFPRITINPTPSSAKTATPTKDSQTISPDTGKLLSSVTVNPIPDEYIIPTGSQTITTNGTVNVTNLASVVVDVPNKTSEITITENGVYNVKAGEVGYSKITVNVQAPSGE